jgi:hypothetical protein
VLAANCTISPIDSSRPANNPFDRRAAATVRDIWLPGVIAAIDSDALRCADDRDGGIRLRACRLGSFAVEAMARIVPGSCGIHRNVMSSVGGVPEAGHHRAGKGWRACSAVSDFGESD